MATVVLTLQATIEIDADDLFEFKTEKEEHIARLEDMGFDVKIESEEGVHALGAPDHDDDDDDEEDDYDEEL